MRTWYAGSPQHLVLTIVDFQWSVEYKALYPSIQIPSVDPTPREPCNIGRVAWPCIHGSVGSPEVASCSVTVVLSSLWLQPHLALWDGLPPFPVWCSIGPPQFHHKQFLQDFCSCPSKKYLRSSPDRPKGHHFSHALYRGREGSQQNGLTLFSSFSSISVGFTWSVPCVYTKVLKVLAIVQCALNGPFMALS